jgi:hypothetical protein
LRLRQAFVMMYIKYPPSLLAERGIEICHETVRFWWNRFGPMFAAEIRKKRVEAMRAYTHWRWHLDEMYVKINGEMHYLWRAVDQEGEVLESFVSKTRDKAAALKFIKKALRRHGSPKAITRWPEVLQGGDEGDRQRQEAGGGPLGQQQGGEQPPALAKAGASDEPVQEDEDTPEILIGSRLGPPPL